MMKYTKEQRNFVEREKIEKYLTCPICQEIYDDPTRVTCGHTFCKQCLLDWEKKSNQHFCALCREKYESEFSSKDLIAQTILNDSVVTCIYKGCPWKNILSNLNNHVKTCVFDPKNQNYNKIVNWIEKGKGDEGEEKKEDKDKDEDDNDNTCDIGTFNHTCSLKERLFARNPQLIKKAYKLEVEQNKKEQEKEKEKEREKEKEKQREKANNQSIKENLDNNKEIEMILRRTFEKNKHKLCNVERKQNLPHNNPNNNSNNNGNNNTNGGTVNLSELLYNLVKKEQQNEINTNTAKKAKRGKSCRGTYLKKKRNSSNEQIV